MAHEHDTRPEDEAGRGRHADAPQHIPLRGWKDIFIRAWNEGSKDNISLVAGGVTFAVLLALFPGLATLVSVYGLFSDPAQVQQQASALSGVMPTDAQQLLASELKQLTTNSSGTLSIGVVVGILVSLWSASRGMSGLMSALDIAYEEQEKRSFIRFNLVAIVLTVGLVVVGLIAILIVAGVPAIINFIGLGAGTSWVILILQWPVLMVLVVVTLALLYRYAPSRDAPRWAWISPGAVVATVLWIIGSILFTVYVANFGTYNKTYGSLGAVVGLMTWMWLSAYVVLLGAEINAEAERQTKRDTTVGPPRPMGQRGARAADTLGPAQG